MLPRPRLIAVDVGNTHVVAGVFEGARLTLERRIASAPHATPDELTLLLGGVLASEGGGPAPTDAVLGSVVPSLTDPLAETLERLLGRAPLVASTDLPVGMPVAYEDPRTLGVDRFVNALAAYERVRGAVVVVDLGTATKLECVSAEGTYLGGAIAPGLRATGELLVGAAARLSSVELSRPARVVGKSTSASLQSGLVYGWASLVEGLVARARAELGVPARVLMTGGLSAIVSPHVRLEHELAPTLTLEGLRLVWARTRGQGAPPAPPA